MRLMLGLEKEGRKKSRAAKINKCSYLYEWFQDFVRKCYY